MWIHCHNGFDSNLPGQKMENHKIKGNRKLKYAQVRSSGVVYRM